MASKYSYIAYIEGDTSGIVKAMKDVEERSKDLNRRMKVINEGLKFNPESVELLGAKFDTLSEQLENAKTKFEALKKVEEQAKHSRETGATTKDQYAKYIQELTKAENNYKMLEIAAGTAKTQLDNTKESLKQTAFATEGLGGTLSNLNNIGKEFDSELKEINTTLKNGGGAEILEQKYNVLSSAIENTQNKLNALKSAEQNMNAGIKNGTITEDQQRSFQRELDSTANKLTRYQNELESVRNAIDSMGNSTDEATDEIENMSDEIDDLGDSIEAAGKQTVTFGDLLKANILSDLISSGINKIKNGVADFVKQGIELASDLTEVQNVVDVTFGDGAQQIYEWADAAAESFGMSSLAAQEYNGTMGAMLKSMGLTDNAVRQMSMDMVGLAGDMASFYNFDVETVFKKIRSGISGESEPLKELGINMSVANLEAYALAQGIETAYSKMTEAEKATLRYNYLMAQTADAQGDFARTSDSFANQQRILQLQWENLSASLGEKLLPNVNDLTGTLNENMPSIGDKIENVSDIVVGLFDFVIDNHEAILSVITGIGTALAVQKGAKVISDVTGAAKNLFSTVKSGQGLMSALAASLNTQPWVLAVGAVTALTLGLVSFSKAAADADRALKESAEESVKAYEEQTEKVSELEKELDDTNDKIAEIQSKGKLSLTDEEEIGLLKEQNDKLSAQLEIEKAILETKRQQAELDVYELATTDDERKSGSVANIKNQLVQYDEDVKRLEAANEQLNAALATENEIAIKNAEDLVQTWEQNVLNTQQKILEETDSLNKLSDSLDKSSAKGKEASAAINELNKLVSEKIDLPSENADKQIDTKETYFDYMQREGERQLAESQELNAQELADYENNLKAKREALDNDLALRRISEEDYYNQLGTWLEENRNLSSKEYFSALGDYESYLDKKQTAAEKAAEEEQKAEKERQDAITKAQEDAETERVNAIKAYWDKITKMRDYDKIDDETEYKLKAQLVKKYCSENEDTWDSYYKWLYDYTKNQEQEIAGARLEAWEDSSKKLADTLAESYKDLKSQKEQVKKDLQSISLTETVKDKNGNEILGIKSLDAEIEKIDKLKASRDKLKETGISDSLLAEIDKMNYADGSRQRYIDELLNLPADVLQDYYADWERLQDKQEEFAQDAVSDKLDELNQEAAQGAKNIFGNLPAEAYEEGVETARQYLQGIIDNMGGLDNAAAISSILDTANRAAIQKNPESLKN